MGRPIRPAPGQAQTTEDNMNTTIPTHCKTRGEAHDAYLGTFPDERAGAQDLEMEQAIRAEGDYCSQQSVERCTLCPLCSYGRDCRNNAVAKDVSVWTGDQRPMTAEESEVAAKFFR